MCVICLLSECVCVCVSVNCHLNMCVVFPSISDVYIHLLTYPQSATDIARDRRIRDEAQGLPNDSLSLQFLLASRPPHQPGMSLPSSLLDITFSFSSPLFPLLHFPSSYCWIDRPMRVTSLSYQTFPFEISRASSATPMTDTGGRVLCDSVTLFSSLNIFRVLFVSQIDSHICFCRLSCVSHAERLTWPYLSLIRCHTEIEVPFSFPLSTHILLSHTFTQRVLDECWRQCQQNLYLSPAPSDGKEEKSE